MNKDVLSASTTVQRITWDNLEQVERPEGGFALITASDCTYKEALTNPLLQTVAALLSPSGVAVLVHELRNVSGGYCTVKDIYDIASRWGLRPCAFTPSVPYTDTQEPIIVYEGDGSPVVALCFRR
mmetsp:Transcript_60877/g.132182  ORF Transcript_60877/g.132182 Transcript_60877/m.132182 type:complete len:126 (+) Transcript_60877:329-706(+)